MLVPTAAAFCRRGWSRLNDLGLQVFAFVRDRQLHIKDKNDKLVAKLFPEVCPVFLSHHHLAASLPSRSLCVLQPSLLC